MKKRKAGVTGKRILVTGAAGFIGANLVRKLVLLGEKDVHIFIRKTSNCWRIKDILPYVHTHSVDITDEKAVRSAITKIKPKIIFHTATYGGYPYQKDEALCIRTNVDGIRNLFVSLRKIKYDSFINLGSASEYGPKTAPMKETDTLTPSDIYGATKALATMIAERERTVYRKPVTTMRPFSAYGPYEDKGRLIPYVVFKCIKGEPLEIKSPASTRDLIYIDDVVLLILEAAAKRKGLGVLNMGGARTRTVRRTAEIIKNLTRSRSRISFAKAVVKRIEPRPWVADMSKTNKVLGWKDATCIEEGIKKTAEWMASHSKYYE